MPARALAALRAAPATLPALPAIGLFVAWAASQAGYPVGDWAPGALLVLALLALVAVLVPPGRPPLAVLLALGLLAGYTAWSFLSITWAGQPAEAWDGSNRTLLYLAVFTLFALWRQRPETGALLVGTWALALVVLAAVTVLRIAEADGAGWFSIDGRLLRPVGYPNAEAALWLMPLWPCVALAASARVPWPVRAVLAGGAVLLVDLALLCLSRGALFALPITLVLFVAIAPGRLRHLTVLVPGAVAVVAALPALLDVGEILAAEGTRGDGAAVDAGMRAALLGAVLAGGVTAVVGGIETRRPPSAHTAARVHRVGSVVALAGLAAGVVTLLAVFGNPMARLEDGWASFKQGYPEVEVPGRRLTSGLGSNRYDFYRVAWGVFERHPVAGVGADNYLQEYLQRGRSSETPRYPHSWQLRTLQQTGVVGALLLLGAFAAAAFAALRAVRGRDSLRRAAAAGALGAFAYWLVHGTADWFWEYAGLGAPAFAMLGVACALGPRRDAGRQPADTAEPAAAGRTEPAMPSPRRRQALLVAGAPALLVAAVSVTLPWLSQRDVLEAGATWPQDPEAAYDRLDRAAALNPLGEFPALVEGTIALRMDDLGRADRAFAAALERAPGNAYAFLQRGAIASAQGDNRRAESFLRRAVARAPRDELAQRALRTVRRGLRIDIRRLNGQVRRRGEELAGG